MRTRTDRGDAAYARHMEIAKPSDADRAFFRQLVPAAPGVEVKAMFGNLGAFVNGNMFAGLFGPSVGVRLDDAGRDELSAIAGAGPFGPVAHPMGGYVSLPAAWRGGAADRRKAEAWVGRALAHVAALPAKIPKPTKPTKTAKPTPTPRRAPTTR